MGKIVGRMLGCLVLAGLAGCAGAAMEGANMARDEVVYQNNLQAAQAGDAEAQYKVGAALCCSLGDRKAFYDTSAATDWLCRSAEQGYAPAAQKLGQVYSGHVVEGVRVMRRIAERVSDRPQNLPVSYAWLRVAEAHGAPDAAEDAGELWSGLSAAQQSQARDLMAGGGPLPCRWDEVIDG